MRGITIKVHFHFAFTKPEIAINFIRDHTEIGSEETALALYWWQDVKILAQFSSCIVTPACMKVQHVLWLFFYFVQVDIIKQQLSLLRAILKNNFCMLPEGHRDITIKRSSFRIGE